MGNYLVRLVNGKIGCVEYILVVVANKSDGMYVAMYDKWVVYAIECGLAAMKEVWYDMGVPSIPKALPEIHKDVENFKRLPDALAVG